MGPQKCLDNVMQQCLDNVIQRIKYNKKYIDTHAFLHAMINGLYETGDDGLTELPGDSYAEIENAAEYLNTQYKRYRDISDVYEYANFLNDTRFIINKLCHSLGFKVNAQVHVQRKTAAPVAVRPRTTQQIKKLLPVAKPATSSQTEQIDVYAAVAAELNIKLTDPKTPEEKQLRYCQRYVFSQYQKHLEKLLSKNDDDKINNYFNPIFAFILTAKNIDALHTFVVEQNSSQDEIISIHIKNYQFACSLEKNYSAKIKAICLESPYIDKNRIFSLLYLAFFRDNEQAPLKLSPLQKHIILALATYIKTHESLFKNQNRLRDIGAIIFACQHAANDMILIEVINTLCANIRTSFLKSGNSELRTYVVVAVSGDYTRSLDKYSHFTADANNLVDALISATPASCYPIALQMKLSGLFTANTTTDNPTHQVAAVCVEHIIEKYRHSESVTDQNTISAILDNLQHHRKTIEESVDLAFTGKPLDKKTLALKQQLLDSAATEKPLAMRY